MKTLKGLFSANKHLFSRESGKGVHLHHDGGDDENRETLMFTAAESSEENHTEKTAARLLPVSLRPASNFIGGINRRDVPVSCFYVIGFYFVFVHFCLSCE